MSDPKLERKQQVKRLLRKMYDWEDVVDLIYPLCKLEKERLRVICNRFVGNLKSLSKSPNFFWEKQFLLGRYADEIVDF